MNNNYGFIKTATAVFDIQIGDIASNVKKIQNIIDEIENENASLVVFPELCLTGYSCHDLFLRKSFIDKVEKALSQIKTHNAMAVVGAPLINNGKLYNCGVIIKNDAILAVVPKKHIPNYGEFYERRQFTSADETVSDFITLNGREIPFGTDIIIETSTGIRLACEICEDLWVSTPPSSYHTMNGANVIVNPSASNDIVTKKEYRKNLVKMQSAKCNCAYIYSSAGSGESTMDVVYGGHSIISSCGTIIKESSFLFGDNWQITYGVIDIEKIENDKIKMNSVSVTNMNYKRIKTYQRIENICPEFVNPYPFIPRDTLKRKERCTEIIHLQATGLATRLKKTGIKKSVIGVSGGLDSTLALLVAKDAYDMLGYQMNDIIGITMPGFGTTELTRTSADDLMDEIGVDARTIDIKASCKQHFLDINHKEDNYDVTYENSQARERTQILMDVANQECGLVIGTGDLSELALGWCTYNGDHMSNYAVNVSIPKTLVRYIIMTYADTCEDERLRNTLYNICNTVISPELLPPDENGNISQSTENSIGKYDLHDFFLYNFIRNGFDADKLYYLAKIAFNGIIPEEQILKTLNIFVKRFIQNQFKRSALPDGPKIGTVSLSPRGDWRMPSDMCIVSI